MVVFVQQRAGEAAVEEGGGAVDGRRVSCRLNDVAESRHDGRQFRRAHVAVLGRLNVVKHGVVERAAVQDGKAELRFALRHFHIGGIAEVVNAHRNVVARGAGIVLFKAGVHLLRPVFSAVAGADDGKIHVPAACHGAPVDVPLIIGDVNSLQGDMHLAGGVCTVGKIGRHGGNAVAHALHAAVAHGGHAGIAGAPGAHGCAASVQIHSQRGAFSRPDRKHGLAESGARGCGNGSGRQADSEQEQQSQGEREQFFWHRNLHSESLQRANRNGPRRPAAGPAPCSGRPPSGGRIRTVLIIGDLIFYVKLRAGSARPQFLPHRGRKRGRKGLFSLLFVFCSRFSPETRGKVGDGYINVTFL